MKILILGTGQMSVSIASYLSCFDFVDEIYLNSESKERVNLAIERIYKNRKIAARKQKIQIEIIKCEIKPLKKEDMIDFDFVIEATNENLSKKISAFQAIIPFLNKDTIVSTNTSSLSVTELSNHVIDSSLFVGLHFFNPVSDMPLVEIIRGYSTTDETIEKVKTFCNKIKKNHITLNESPGLVVNRLIIPMINEAIGLFAEKIATRDEIDKALKLGANHPMGPLELSDFIGNDIVLSIMQTLYTETGDPKYRAHPYLTKIVRANALGRKTKRGFYEYK